MKQLPIHDPSDQLVIGNWNCDFNETGSCPSNCDNKEWKYATDYPVKELKNWNPDTSIRITSGYFLI